MTNLKIDKYFLSTMNSRFIKLLNSELDKKGKELAKDNFNALDERIASQRPRQKRIKGFKHLQSYEQRLAQGEKLSEREMRAYNTLLEKSNKHAIKLYDEAQALKSELKATKSACKKFIKDEKMPYFNDKFDFLEQSPIFENGENAELLNALQNERLAFFKDLRDFTDEFDIKQKGVNEFLNALNAFDERLEKAQRDFIENLEQNTIKISLFNEQIALNANEIQGYANRKLNELERAYYVVVDEDKAKNERNEKLDFFELETSQMLTQTPTLYERVRTFLCEKFKDSINAVSDFIAHYKAKLRNDGHRM